MKNSLLLLLLLLSPLAACGASTSSAAPTCMTCVETNTNGCTWWVAEPCADGGEPVVPPT